MREAHNDPMGHPVVRTGDGSEALLPGSVPLQRSTHQHYTPTSVVLPLGGRPPCLLPLWILLTLKGIFQESPSACAPEQSSLPLLSWSDLAANRFPSHFPASKVERCAYDLQLDDLPIQLHRPDFLHNHRSGFQKLMSS